MQVEVGLPVPVTGVKKCSVARCSSSDVLDVLKEHPEDLSLIFLSLFNMTRFLAIIAMSSVYMVNNDWIIFYPNTRTNMIGNTF